MNLRKAARGQHCQVEIAGVCNYNKATTVLAHIRMGNAGIGRKPHDAWGVHACSNCHDMIDGRMKPTDDFAANKWWYIARALGRMREAGF